MTNFDERARDWDSGPKKCGGLCGGAVVNAVE
jgi:hypothetical protein